MVLQEIKNFPKTSGIYKITNPRGRVYIGQAKNIQKRLRYYLYKVPLSTKIGRSIHKYGIENHIVEVLELTKDLDNREIFYIKHLNTVEQGLNCIYRSYKIGKTFKGGSMWSTERKEKHSKRIKELHQQGNYDNRTCLGENLKGKMSVLDVRDGKVKRVSKEDYSNFDFFVGTTKGKDVIKRRKKVLDTRTETIYDSVITCISELKINNVRFYNLVKKNIIVYI